MGSAAEQSDSVLRATSSNVKPPFALRHIVFITGNYPSPAHPNRGTFVRQLVEAIAGLGTRCTVIHPWKLHEWLLERRLAVGCGASMGGVHLVRPLMLSLSNRGVAGLNTFALTHREFRRAVLGAIKRQKVKPDAVYGHFLYSAGEVAVWAGRRLGIPRFVAVGEGTFWTVKPLGVPRARRDFQHATGILAVSTVLKRRLEEDLGIPSEKIGVFPNGVDLDTFAPKPRAAMRQKFGLPADAFLVIYVGNFIESKGAQRVAAAIDGQAGLGGIFVGSGPVQPRASNVVFCGRVQHALVPELLSAANCFVLPSDVEGSSNATIEAMACGLPLVVSDGEYNDDIVNEEVAIRVRHDDINAIRSAISRLFEDSTLRGRMSMAATSHAQGFDIRERARRILRWMATRSVSILQGCSPLGQSRDVIQR